MKSYEELRDALVAERTKQIATIKSNQECCKRVRSEIDMISSLDTSLAEMHGIDVNYVLNIDLDKIAEDKEYHKQVQTRLSVEIEKICELLGGILS